jgi:O-methyltransferase
VPTAESQTIDPHLELIKLALAGALGEKKDQVLGGKYGEGPWRHRVANRIGDLVQATGVELVRERPLDPALRLNGLDRPGCAESMIGSQRMDNIRSCVDSMLDEGVERDLIEAGAWRGGATISTPAVLEAHGGTGRTVWAADSSQGLPAPDVPRHPADRDDPHRAVSELRVGVDQARSNFRRYGLLDDHVKFLVGWFKDTLPSVPIKKPA